MPESCTRHLGAHPHILSLFMTKRPWCSLFLSALFSQEYHVRLILLGFILHWKDQLPVGGLTVYSQMVKKKVSATRPIECYVRLTREW